MNEPPVAKKPFLTLPEVAGSVVILLLVLVFGRLCLWQVARLRERRADNARIAARLHAAPIPGISGIADTTGALYRRMHIRGTYDNAHTVVFPGRSYMGTPGVHLLTPVVLPNGSAVLVNRGWVPSPDGAAVDLAKLDAAQLDSTVGLVLPFPGRSQSVSPTADSVPATGEFRRVWYTIDEAAFRAQFPYPLAPFMLQRLPGPGPFTIPRALDPPALDEGPHLSYALQWFSFAVIAIVGWITFLLRNRAVRTGASRIVRGPPHPPRL